MVWPFSKKTSGLSPEVERIFEKISYLLENDAEQLALYPEPLRARLLAGTNVDCISAGVGPFGQSIKNPIPVNGPIGEMVYLSSLRFGEQRLLFHRVRSINEIDIYECVTMDGASWDILFLDMYHPRKSKLSPRDYSMVSNPLFGGVNREVSGFPELIYEAIAAHTKSQFGMSLADPRIRQSIEKINFQKPRRHATRIARIVSGNFEIRPDDLIEELTNEAIGCQTSIYDRLSKFAEVGLNREDIRMPEIVYFVLSLTVHSIFQFSQISAKSDIADKISLNVLKMNIESNGIRSPLSEAVAAYQGRFRVYRAAILQMTKEHGDLRDAQFQFGLLLSQNLTGKNSPVFGAFLSSAVGVILAELNEIIVEVESV